MTTPRLYTDREMRRGLRSGRLEGTGFTLAAFGAQGLWSGDPAIESVDLALFCFVGLILNLASFFLDPRS